MEKEHTALEELFHCVLIVPLVKQWDVVMAVQQMTVLGVCQNVCQTLSITSFYFYKLRIMNEKLLNHINDIISVPCAGGKYLNEATGCQSCEVGTYSAGGTVSQCSNCPSGKTVARGNGGSESDCTWSKSGFEFIHQIWRLGTTYQLRRVNEKLQNHINVIISVPCAGGQYLNEATGCQSCEVGTYSAGGTVSQCSNCPSGKTVARGNGGSDSDCTWSKSGFEFKCGGLVVHIIKYNCN